MALRYDQLIPFWLEPTELSDRHYPRILESQFCERLREPKSSGFETIFIAYDQKLKAVPFFGEKR
jgi:hypothetical protein